jgi:hypothetical protein
MFSHNNTPQQQICQAILVGVKFCDWLIINIFYFLKHDYTYFEVNCKQKENFIQYSQRLLYAHVGFFQLYVHDFYSTWNTYYSTWMGMLFNRTVPKITAISVHMVNRFPFSVNINLICFHIIILHSNKFVRLFW